LELRGKKWQEAGECCIMSFVTWYPSPNIIRVIKSRRMRWVGHVAHMGEMRNAYKILVGKSEGKRPLGTLRRIAGKIIVEWEGVDCMHPALVNMIMNLQVP
jgi:hypothetical protein